MEQQHSSSFASSCWPQLALLHQDVAGTQHVTSHLIHCARRQLYLYGSPNAPIHTPWLKKSSVDGGSSLLIPVQLSASTTTSPAAAASMDTSNRSQQQQQQQQSQQQVLMGGVVVVGQRQLTYCSCLSGGGSTPTSSSSTYTKIIPIPQAIFLTYTELPVDPTGNPRFLLGDEFGNLHVLTLVLMMSTNTNNNSATAMDAMQQQSFAVASHTMNAPATPLTKVVAMHLETLGSCTLSNCLEYLGDGLVFVGSTMGDSQLMQIHDEPIITSVDDDDDGNNMNIQPIAKDAVTDPSGISLTNADEDGATGTGPAAATGASATDADKEMELHDTTFLSVVEEYTHLGPIVDFDLVPTTPGNNNTASSSNNNNPSSDGNANDTSAAVATSGSSTVASTANSVQQHLQQQQQQVQPHPTYQYQQSQVVTASGSSKSGSLRLIRNGIGMNEYAAVEIPGIQAMWSVRQSYHDEHDTYLVQAFVGETRVLGVTNNSTNDATMTMEDADDEMKGGDDALDEDVGGTLEEVFLPGLEPTATTLYVGNVQPGDRLLQITDFEIRLVARDTLGESEGMAATTTPDLSSSSLVLDRWTSDDGSPITVAAANEAGQIAVAIRVGTVLYLEIDSPGNKIQLVFEQQMDRQISCLDLHPFARKENRNSTSNMDIDSDKQRPAAIKSQLLAVGLWDDFTVRLLSLGSNKEQEAMDGKLSLGDELLCIHLGTDEDEDDDGDKNNNAGNENGRGEHVEGTDTGNTIGNNNSSSRRSRSNMMARSLSLVTLDFSSSAGGTHNSNNGGHSNSNNSSSTTSPGVNMLFVGLGDGTLISFAVVMSSKQQVSVQAKKEVCLGTQRIDLVPLTTERGGTCVLATGDRPTVIYLAGIGGTLANQFNPKLCYSNVNLAVANSGGNDGGANDDVSRPPSQQSIAVNVAAPFYSPLLFDAASLGNQHYSLCVADETNLRLGVIDDIQKLHVTTCRLGMAPRRIVHCPDGRLFAVGCIESGIKHFGLGTATTSGMDEDATNMQNCIRFMDDTTFDDLDRVDLEPFETICSMLYATLQVPSLATPSVEQNGTDGGGGNSFSSSGNAPVYENFLLVGTAYALPDEDEPTRGRILVYSCQGHDGNTNGGAGAGGATAGAATSGGEAASSGRVARRVTELATKGAVYSMCQFYHGRILCTVNSKTHMARLALVASLSSPSDPLGGSTNQIQGSGRGWLQLAFVGASHHGHILSLFVRSRAKLNNKLLSDVPVDGGESVGDADNQNQQAMDLDASNEGGAGQTVQGNKTNKKKEIPQQEMLAIVADLMRSISLVQYYPQHETIEEVARDFNARWTTAVEMLCDSVYLGAENWNNLYCLRRNIASSSEEVRCRLDTIGEFHLGEMCNKFMSGSLVMPVSSNSVSGNDAKRSAVRRIPLSPSPQKKRADTPSSKSKSVAGVGASAGLRVRRPIVVVGSQTLFGTVDGTLGVILGLDARTAAFFAALERALAAVLRPVGDFSHALYRAVEVSDFQSGGMSGGPIHPSHGFIDGDLVESFLDLDRNAMEVVVAYMNRDGGWQVDDPMLTTSTNARGSASGNDDDKEPASADGMEGDDPDDRPGLSVDDVLAMVEEMTMLH